MSDSESDTDFESADEGEEIIHPAVRASHNLKNIITSEMLSSDKVSNDRQERYCNASKKEESEYSSFQEVCKADLAKSIGNPDNDCFSDGKTSNIDEKGLQIIGNSNRENVADHSVVVSDNDSTELKYTEDAYINEKTKSIEKGLGGMKIVESKQLVSKSLRGDFNSEENSDLIVRESYRNKEKPKRVMLKLEKKLSEKSKLKSTNEVTEPKNLSPVTTKEEELAQLDTSNQMQALSWGWGNWSSSLLATAASSVSAFTSQVSEGIGTVLETVESTLGAPPPEELAAVIESKKKELQNSSEIAAENEADVPQENSSSLFDVSSLSRVIENTGSKVLMTGLDTLELIGKTTIDILTEGDPGLRKKRSYFKNSNLSEILREAKDKAEAAPGNVNISEDKTERTIHYTTLFDNFQGIVHLEALEILSKQNKTMLQGWLLSQAENNVEAKEKTNEIQEICENLPAVDDTLDEGSHQEFLSLLKDYTQKLELSLNIIKIEEVHKTIHEWLKNCQKEQDKGEAKDAVELHQEALKSMAHLTACSVEIFHKVAEIILCKNSDIISAVSLASYLTEITGILCFEIGIIAATFCHCLNTAADDSEDPDSVAPLITNVYLEASNSNTYIQDAFQLLVPILQMVAIKQNSCFIYTADLQKCDTNFSAAPSSKKLEVNSNCFVKGHT